MKIGVCDDEKWAREALIGYINTTLPSCEIAQFVSGNELIDYMTGVSNDEIDILFLDIAMEQMDGMMVAEKLRQNALAKNKSSRASKPLIIFVTGMDNMILDSFKVCAFDYILKPIAGQRIKEVLERAISEIKSLDKIISITDSIEKPLTVKSGSTIFSVLPKDISYVESIGRKLVIHCTDRTIETYGKIGEWEQNLGSNFFRAHKSYLINMGFVKGYTREDITLLGGGKVLLSKYRYNDFVKNYMNFIAGETL